MEARSFRVQGRVTETIINKMEQAKILNPEFNESLQISRALEMMYTDRGKTSKFENLADASMTKSTILDLQSLQNRVNMRQLVSEMYVLVELMTVKIRSYPKSSDTSKDIRDLARVVYDIKAYSDEYYKISHDIALKLLKKGQKGIFTQQIDECTRVYPVAHIIGGTLDEPENNISDLVSNCMTVPKNHRDGKITDALHYITQHYDDSHNTCEAFLHAIERKENENRT